MTQAQKTAKAKFKQAIAYRQKTGVSLKEAFAHIYGKKVGAVKSKPYKGYQYTIDENETGNFVDKYYTLTEAKKDLKRLQAKSKKSGKYKEDFYRITEINSGKTIFGIKKKTTKKKVAKKIVNKKYSLNKKKDKLYSAKKPGKRIAKKSGKTYYESRPNRSDKGKLLGIKNESKILDDYKTILGKVSYYQNTIQMYRDAIKNYKTRGISPAQLLNLKLWIKTHSKLLSEYKIHAKQLKKLI